MVAICDRKVLPIHLLAHLLGGQPPKEFGVGIPGGYEESLCVAGYSGHPSVSLGGFQKLDDLNMIWSFFAFQCQFHRKLSFVTYAIKYIDILFIDRMGPRVAIVSVLWV